jgi:ribosome-associated heat shock protein Hsp15
VPVSREQKSQLRIDKWLWQARFFKSRTLAAGVCRAKKVRVNGAHCSKASTMVSVGDVLTFPKATEIRVVKILALGSRRGPASEAELLYDDMTPPSVKSGAQDAISPVNPSREKGAGRPTKTDRRALDKFMDYDPDA